MPLCPKFETLPSKNFAFGEPISWTSSSGSFKFVKTLNKSESTQQKSSTSAAQTPFGSTINTTTSKGISSSETGLSEITNMQKKTEAVPAAGFGTSFLNCPSTPVSTRATSVFRQTKPIVGQSATSNAVFGKPKSMKSSSGSDTFFKPLNKLESTQQKSSTSSVQTPFGSTINTTTSNGISSSGTGLFGITNMQKKAEAVPAAGFGTSFLNCPSTPVSTRATSVFSQTKPIFGQSATSNTGSQQQGGSEQPTTVLGEFNLKFGETWPTFGKQPQLNLSRKLTVPDVVLDSLQCYNCHKYLSVKPVMICNGKIFCGRCQTSGIREDGGVESKYNVLVDSMLFKCINRFEGCSKLLTVDEVLQHEKTCKSQLYSCPLCRKGSSRLPSYLFLHHVKTFHEKSVLRSNRFVVDLKNSNFTTYLYQKENFLFFIDIYVLDNRIKLSARYIGGGFQHFEVVYQKFSVEKSRDNVIKIQRRKCLHFNENNLIRKFVSIYVGDVEKGYVNVEFEFDVPG